MDRKKKFIPLILTSAMFVMWACGEGDIVNVNDDDERVKQKLAEKLDSTKSDYAKNSEEFIAYFLEYCNRKEGRKDGCDIDIMKFSSSSKAGDNKSSSSKSSSSSKAGDSSSSVASSSSSKGGSSSSVSSSSSKPTSATSSSTSSSSSKTPDISGKCDVIKPDVVYVGDDIIWHYVADEGSIESADYEWKNVSDEIKAGTQDDLKGTGRPEITVTFSKKGTKLGPELTFSGKTFDCPNVDVAEKPVTQSSSSSEPESSSSEPESSSAQSSSSSDPKGYCFVSKRKINAGETVDLFIVDADGNELEGKYQWFELGDQSESAEIVAGEKKGTGSTKITVKYPVPGTMSPAAYWGSKNQLVTCDRNELDPDDDDALLEVLALPVSSSSEEPEEESSSSGEVVEQSSSSEEKDVPFCKLHPEDESCVIDL